MPLPMYNKEKKRMPKIVAVAAGKGGVGKSTVAVNLALGLKNLGYAVGLMDADIYGPSIRKMLPEERMPAQSGERFKPAMSQGIKVMSMAYFRREDESAAVRAPIANGIITQFIQNVDWGELDYLIFDFPPGTGDVQLTLCQKANLAGAVMVTTPQEVALMDVRKAMHLFHQVKIPLLGVIENMSGMEVAGQMIYPFGKGGGEILSQECGIPFLGTIPLDPELCKRGDKGESIFETNTPSKDAFIIVIQKLLKVLGSASKNALSIKQIHHKDDHTFTIEWSDGKIIDYLLSDLQENCPCAGCRDENTGERKINPSSLNKEVKAVNIESVGRYALKIAFTSGCSTGIYSYDMLRGQ